MKKLIIITGLIIGGVSLSLSSSTFGSILFLLGFGSVFAAMAIPPLVIISNFIGETIIDSVIGEKIGTLGCSIIKLLLCSNMHRERKPRTQERKAPVGVKAN